MGWSVLEVVSSNAHAIEESIVVVAQSLPCMSLVAPRLMTR